jgi:hypothetical protein
VCQGQVAQGTPYSLTVSVSLGFDDQSRAFSIAWLGESPTSGARSLHLSKTFDSREAARAFEGTYVVSRAGGEVAREMVRFADCDGIMDLGVDPQSVRGVVVLRSWENEQLSQDTHSNDQSPFGCFLSPPPVPPLLTGPQRVLYQIPSNDRLTFAYAGEDVAPRGIQLFADTKVWEVSISVKESGSSDQGELSVLRDGQPLGSVPVSFAPCNFSGKPVIEEQLRLALSAGEVAVDSNEGVSCLHTDGTGSSAIP